MPTTTTLALFALAALALVAIPGPNIVYIATRSLAEGRRAGIASALGVETGMIVHVLAAAAGLSALVASSAVAFDVVRYVGAAYLAFLGIRALLAREPRAEDGHDDGAAVPARARLERAYLEGLVVNLLNPKVILFVLALLPQFVDPERGSVALQTIVLGSVLLAIGTAIDMSYALLAAWMGARVARLRDGSTRRYVSATVYLALGAAAALSPGARGHR